MGSEEEETAFRPELQCDRLHLANILRLLASSRLTKVRAPFSE